VQEARTWPSRWLEVDGLWAVIERSSEEAAQVPPPGAQTSADKARACTG